MPKTTHRIVTAFVFERFFRGNKVFAKFFLMEKTNSKLCF